MIPTQRGLGLGTGPSDPHSERKEARDRDLVTPLREEWVAEFGFPTSASFCVAPKKPESKDVFFLLTNAQLSFFSCIKPCY